MKKWKRFMIWVVCAAVVISCGSSVAIASDGHLTKSEIIEIQTRLKNWGYYSGTVDGIFGSRTTAAVKYFQSKNGLVVDGIVGSRTAEKLGIQLGSTKTSGSTDSGSNVYLLAKLVYGEARGESYKGQVAVAAVVLNRVDSPLFPNTIAGVIYQKGQFSVVADGQINLAPDTTALNAARDALNGWDPSGGCLYYYNPAKTSNRFLLSRPTVTVIGEHVFC